MQEKKNHSGLTLLDQEPHQLLGAIGEVLYSALPSEQPQIFFVAGRSIKALTGYSAAEIYADRELWINMIHPADRERVFAAFTKCKDQGASFKIGYHIIHKDGSLRYVIDKGGPVFNDKGQIMEIEGIITDISEQKRPENTQSPKIPKATEP